MAKRINITVPDDLFARLQNVKEEFKISKVCQEALMQKVQTVETGRDGDLIEFLRAGKMEFHTKYFDMGQEWAEKAIREKQIPYRELVDLVKQHAKSVDTPRINNPMQILKEFDLEVPKYSSVARLFEDVPPIEEEDFGFNEEAFVRGYLEKCRDIWESVKGKI